MQLTMVYNKPEESISIFLNSVMVFYDNKVLSDTALFLQKSNVDWIYGKINVLEENGKSIGKFPERKIFQLANSTLLKFINLIPHQAVFMKKDVFRKFGGFKEDLKVNMDYELYLRISKHTKWVFFDRIIANDTIRAEAASSGRSNRKASMKILEKVQTKYLNKGELLVAKAINYMVDKCNKTYR